jgi:hypothetical protein
LKKIEIVREPCVFFVGPVRGRQNSDDPGHPPSDSGTIALERSHLCSPRTYLVGDDPPQNPQSAVFVLGTIDLALE